MLPTTYHNDVLQRLFSGNDTHDAHLTIPSTTEDIHSALLLRIAQAHVKGTAFKNFPSINCISQAQKSDIKSVLTSFTPYLNIALNNYEDDNDHLALYKAVLDYVELPTKVLIHHTKLRATTGTFILEHSDKRQEEFTINHPSPPPTFESTVQAHPIGIPNNLHRDVKTGACAIRQDKTPQAIQALS